MADDKIVTDDVEKDDIEGGESKPDIKDDKTDDDEDDKGKDDEEVEPPIREATLQHIIARKNEKIKKLENKADEDNEDELTPEAKTALDRELDRRFEPFRDQEIKRETENLLNRLYSDEPEAKEYDKLIRRFVTFEKDGVKPYEHIPPEVIYHHLAFGKAEAAGAHKKNAAELEANLSKTRGRTNRSKSAKTESGLPTIEEMESMNDSEFSRSVIAPSLQG